MDFQNHVHARLNALKSEGNYRGFADIERRKGGFPTAGRHADGAVTDVTVWCSNDYLGMSQHPQVVQAMIDTVEACGTGAGGTRNPLWQHHSPSGTGTGTGVAAWQASGAAVHHGLCVQLGVAVDAGRPDTGCGDPGL